MNLNVSLVFLSHLAGFGRQNQVQTLSLNGSNVLCRMLNIKEGLSVAEATLDVIMGTFPSPYELRIEVLNDSQKYSVCQNGIDYSCLIQQSRDRPMLLFQLDDCSTTSNWYFGRSSINVALSPTLPTMTIVQLPA